MQRFIKWLGTHLSPNAPEATLPTAVRRIEVGRPPGRVAGRASRRASTPATRAQRPARPANPDLVEFDTDMPGFIEAQGPGKNVLIQNHLLQENSGNHESLRILDDAIAESGEKAGFDPYNTGKFNRAENWRSRD